MAASSDTPDRADSAAQSRERTGRRRGSPTCGTRAALGRCELVTPIEVLPRASQGNDWLDRKG
jgi:hypothetical protein